MVKHDRTTEKVYLNILKQNPELYKRYLAEKKLFDTKKIRKEKREIHPWKGDFNAHN